MTNTRQLMQEELSKEEQRWEEEWEVITSSKGKYTLSKMQALVLKQALAMGNRGTIMFEAFAIAIPYVTDFYRTKRFLKGVKVLPERATEEEFKPISPEKWEAIKKKIYEKIGKSEVSGVNTYSNNRKNNKKKALSVILLLIISGNILFSYHFPLYIFTSIKTLEDSFSHKVEDSYLKVANNANFFNRPYEYSPQTGLKASTSYRNFTYHLGNSTQFKETTYTANLAKGGKTL